MKSIHKKIVNKLSLWPSDATERRPGWKISYLIPITLLFLVCFAVYFNTLSNKFVMDDFHQVVDNYQLRAARYIPEIFSTSLWAFEGRNSNYYRPLLYVIYMLTYGVFGLQPWGFHLVNILLHAGVSALVFLTVSRLLVDAADKRSSPVYLSPSLWAALLFATTPIHTEAVAWVAGVMDLAMSLFYLMSFYLYVRSTEGETVHRTMFLLSVTSFFFATLSKEPALTFPAVLITYDVICRGRAVPFDVRVKRYIPYFAAAGLYFIMRVYALKGFAPVKGDLGLSSYEYLINAVVLFSRYLEKLLFPLNLNVWHVFRPVASLYEAKGMLSLLVVGTFIVVSVLALKKSRLALFGLLFIAIPLLPALYLPGLTQGIENAFAERYLYLPSFGFVVLLASVAALVKKKQRIRASALTVVFTIVLVIYSIGTITRNSVWKDSLSLWSDAVGKSPESAIAHQNLGFALLYAGQTDEGKRHLAMASTLDPRAAEPLITAGIAHAQKGLIDKAILKFHAALALNAASPAAHYNLGLAYDVKGWTDQAIEQYNTVLMLQPDNGSAHNNLGIAYAKKGLPDKAIEQFEAAVRLNGSDEDFRANLEKARELMKKGVAGHHGAR